VSADTRQRVVINNGPSGVGKTTIGRLLAARVTNGVCIHGDALAGFIVARDLDAVSVCYKAIEANVGSLGVVVKTRAIPRRPPQRSTGS
jgi:predicted ABC-type ATPase